MKVNLLPYQMAQKAGPNWRTIFALGGVVLLAAVTLIFYVALQARVTSYEARITDADQKYQNYVAALGRKDLLDQLQAAYTQKSGFIQQLSGQGVEWNLIMDEIRDIIPRTVVLDEVTSNTEGVITIDGRAGSLQALAQFMVNIEKAKYIAQPDIKTATWDTEANAFVFVMLCTAKAEAVNQGG